MENIDSVQISFPDLKSNNEQQDCAKIKCPNKEENTEFFKKFKSYDLKQYVSDVELLGLDEIWNQICDFILKNPTSNSFFDIDGFGKLYEMGLAIKDKEQKKSFGQYYTPQDVATVMNNWLLGCDGKNICDVACGTGTLILAFLDLIGYDKARETIKQGKIFLYDIDATALKICKTALTVKYGADICDSVNIICADFLDEKITLPKNSKVIANPPYASISTREPGWEQTEIIKKTHELYAAFMEKLFIQADSVVIITPYSFISGNKFYPLRKLMCDKGYGSIVSFDNVPGNIFNGKKQGIFNSNTSNSVRAAITVFNKNKTTHGFKVSNLIRFKSSERDQILKNTYLENLLPSNRQIINSQNKKFKKIDVKLTSVFENWTKYSNQTLKNLTVQNGRYTLYMPNTCRYYTSASNIKMNRSGQLAMSFDDKDIFNYVFCMVNSSFVYWHWRIYDGGITYPKNLLEDLPTFFDILSKDDKLFFESLTNEMIEKTNDFIVTKKNIGVQENIKYPKEYRDKINEKILNILNVNENAKIFDIIHSNSALGEKHMIPLTNLQTKIMSEFYSYEKTRVIFNKKERNILWKRAVKKDSSLDVDALKIVCPA